MERYYLLSRITTLFQGTRKVTTHAESNHQAAQTKTTNAAATGLTSAVIYHTLMNKDQRTPPNYQFLDPYNFFSK